MRKLMVVGLMTAMVLGAAIRHAQAYTIDGVLSFQVSMNDRRTIGINSNTNIPVNVQPSVSFTNGTGANQCQGLYQAAQTFSGTTSVMNFGTAGGLVDSYGTAIAWTAIKAIYVNNTGTASIAIGAGSNPMVTLLNSTGTITLPPGGIFAAANPSAAGWVVTASTACNITVTGTSGQTFQIVVAGQ